MATVRIEPVNGLVYVDAASTANLTLSGAQTVDGQALTAGMFCLAKNQSDNKNAVYLVQTGAWVACDPGVGLGLQVMSKAGTTNTRGTTFRCTTADPIVWGTSTVSFVAASGSGGGSFDPAAPGPIGATTPGKVNTTGAELSGLGATPAAGNLGLGRRSDSAADGLYVINDSGSRLTVGQLNNDSPTASSGIYAFTRSVPYNTFFDYTPFSIGGMLFANITFPGSAVAPYMAHFAFNGDGETVMFQASSIFSTVLGSAGKFNISRVSPGVIRFENLTEPSQDQILNVLMMVGYSA